MRFLFILGFLSFSPFLSTSSSFALQSVLIEKPAEELFVRWGHLDEETKTQIEEKFGLLSVWESSFVSGLQRYVIEDQKMLEEIVDQLQRLKAVQYAEKNKKFHRELLPLESDPQVTIAPSEQEGNPQTISMNQRSSDPYFDRQWALRSRVGIQVEEAWKTTKGSSSVKVAVIDTGVDQNHPDLKDRVTAGYDFISRSAQVRDTHGHGTHVSGIIGARVDNQRGIAGINAEVTIMPIRAVPNRGDETDADVIASFEFAAKHGARVANCSFGKDLSGRAVKDTIEATGKKGVLAVIAAGNDGSNLNRSRSYPASFYTSNSIVVAASTINDRLAFFSNYGLGRVHIAAPGQSIISTITRGRYASWDGTSMAAPQVSGVAALTIAAYPEIKVDELKKVILENASHVPGYRDRIDDGRRLNAAKAVKAAHQLHLRRKK